MNELTPWIQQAAAYMGRAYRPWTTTEDIKQHLWQWAVSNRDRVEEYLTLAEGERIIRTVLNQEARKYAIKERAEVSGYKPEDLAWYTPTALKKILPDVFDYEDWQSFQQKGGEGGGGGGGQSGDRLATIIDVKSALEKLPKDTVHLLRMFYADGFSLEHCSQVLMIEPAACRKRLQRAINSLSVKLNNPRPTDPYEGATYEQWKANQHFYDTRGKFRRAVSNASARAGTDI